MYDEALLFAIKAHENQIRKDGKPYIIHPVSVALELAKNGADDDLICAGLLHDTVEDTNITFEDLRANFNERIVDLISFETEDKSLSWEERKENTIKLLKNTDNRDYHMLVCADKLSNIKDIESDIKVHGDNIWNIFKRGKEQQKKLYENLIKALTLISDLPMYQELKNKISYIFD